MATATTVRKRKSKSTGARGSSSEKRLRPQNKKMLRWLDSWLATPDDRGEAWWSEFEADLQRHRIIFRPTEGE